MSDFDHSNYNKNRYRRRIAAAKNLLGGSCAECGCEDQEELEFDHIVPADKTGSISDLVAKSSKAKVQMELGKCQLLCVSCHSAKTSKEKSTTKNRFGEWKCDCGRKFKDRMAMAGHKRWCNTAV